MNTQDRRQQEADLLAAKHRAQQMRALGIANQVRFARASLKRDLKAGRKSVIDILLSPPEYVETMKVFDLLIACPKYGRVKVSTILKKCQISPSRRMENMTLRERTKVVSFLR